MKNLFKCAALCILLFSCKKDIDSLHRPLDQTKAKRFEITFNVSEFSNQVSGVSKGNSVSDAPLEGNAKLFYYIAYDAEGKEVSRINQTPTSLGVFGCITDSLPAGEYTIVMIASKRDFSINSRSEAVLGPSFEPISEANFYYDRGLNSWSRADDTFFKKFSLSVEEKDAQHNVVLDRIVGKAEINILDSRPGTSYKFLFVNENEAFKFSNEKSFSGTEDVDLEETLQAVPGVANLVYHKFLLNTETPIDVIIKVFENGQLSASKTVEGVRFYKNKRTILTGNIYTPKANTTGFNVTVNDEFDADSVVVSF